MTAPPSPAATKEDGGPSPVDADLANGAAARSTAPASGWRSRAPLIAACVSGLLCLLLSWLTGGLSPSLINPDEGGHYVNALFLGDWLRAGMPSPLAYAQDYYAHFPRLTIGHWPPGWYMLEAPLFALARPSPLATLVLSAFVAGLPAGTIVWAFARMGRLRWGLALALAYLLLPLVVDAARFILLDQPVALVVALAAIVWVRATEQPSWPRLLLFGVLAAAAPLVKGNGALVALLPAIDIAIGRRWRLLRLPALWGAAMLALLLVAPWYWVSFKVSAGAFIYEPGLAYARLAIGANSSAILANIGFAGLALALIGATAVARPVDPPQKRIAQVALSVVLATLLFQSSMPAALEPRYITPLLPWLVVLAGIGAITLGSIGKGGAIAATALGAIALYPAAEGLRSLRPKHDIGAARIAGDMMRSPGLWLVDGRAGGEGALIAAAAYADGERKQLWIARASQWLSTSNFMGGNYKLTVTTPAAARAELQKLGARGAVSVADRNRYAYPHSRLLHQAAADPQFVRTTERFARGDGQLLVARRIRPIAPNIALISRNSGSANVAKMNKSLD